MYLHESTPAAVRGERDRLLRAQLRTIQSLDDLQRPRYADGEPLYDNTLLPQLLLEAGVPSQTTHHRISQFTDGPLAKAAAEFTAQFDDVGERITTPGQLGMVLAGVPTTGKTSFACAALRYAAWRWHTVKFIDNESLSKFFTTWIELSQNASQYDDYQDRADGWRAELWRMLHVYAFLVIDDIGRTKVPEFVLDELHTLIRTRTAQGCYTIITSNLSVEDFGRKVGTSSAEFVRREFTVVGIPEKFKINAGR